MVQLFNQQIKPVYEKNFGERLKDLFQPRIVSPIPEEDRTFGQKLKDLFLPPTPPESPRIKVTGEPLIDFSKLFKKEEPTPMPKVEIQPSPEPAKELFKPEAKIEPQKTTTIARNPAISKFKVSDVVKDAITKAAEKYSVPSDLLFDIALQESSFDPAKINPTAPPGLNPLGLFQFTDETWETVKAYEKMKGSSLKLPNYDRFDPYTNALAAAYLIKFGQLGRWDASKEVWGPYYSEDELSSHYSQTLSRK